MDNQLHVREAELDLPPSDTRTTRVRRFIRETLADWEYRGDPEDVALVASEMVTNAVLHAEGAALLRLSGTPWRVRIEVADSSTVQPLMRDPGGDGGWGLRLIENLGVGWGTLPRDGGKVVWCELAPAVVPAEAAG